MQESKLGQILKISKLLQDTLFHLKMILIYYYFLYIIKGNNFENDSHLEIK